MPDGMNEESATMYYEDVFDKKYSPPVDITRAEEGDLKWQAMIGGRPRICGMSILCLLFVLMGSL